MAEQPSSRTKAPPQLHFDDGSRIIQPSLETGLRTPHDRSCIVSSPHPPVKSFRGDMSIHVYYEIDRLTEQVLDLVTTRPRTLAAGMDDGWLCRIALQFPDSLLVDAADVVWELEEAFRSFLLPTLTQQKQPLIFILGDTTFGSCCPDEVAALHLEADVIIHFGHACLSPTMTLPVIYSFGIHSIDITACVALVMEQIQQSGVDKILLLFQVSYHHAIDKIQSAIAQRGDIQVVVGMIPNQDLMHQAQASLREESEDNANEKCVKIGGLNIPEQLDISAFTALYIGDTSNNRQFVNIMMTFTSLSTTQSPSAIWTFDPNNSKLDTTVPTSIQRQLNRRFYLIQKARNASTFGILVGTLSQRHFTSVVSSLQTCIHNANRYSYTFAMGKINDTKLANFSEIDCFILIACHETSLLELERDLPVPVITPWELNVALGKSHWGDPGNSYTLDYTDFLMQQNESKQNATTTNIETDDHDTAAAKDGDDETDNDAPYFSLLSGAYEDSRPTASTDASVNLSALPGQGQLSTYTSKGAEFLKKRLYQGLETQLGETPVHTAVTGQSGIASNYSER